MLYFSDLTRSHDHLNAYIIVLKAFEDKLRFLQSDQYPTINHVLIAFYELENHLDHLKGSDNVLIKALWTSVSFILKNMKIHFTKPLHYAACTMDIFQRAKIRQLREISEVKKAKEETEKLFLEYVKQITPTIDKTNEVHPDIDDFAMCADDELESNQNSAIISAKNELAQYYRYIPSAESIAQKDVLLFWKSVESQFPQLSKFVSSLFQIPASSNCIDKFCPISTKKAAKEKSMDSSMVSNLMLFKSLQNLNL
uniref:HAT C-terminal dimerisation domain-containing protein n=1 Tax=Panagrolaimus sp. ES5 TaxID=591445 RepID=A0AC34GXG8_9BILA